MGGYEQQMAAVAAGYGISLGIMIVSSVLCAVFFFSFRIPETASRIRARKQKRSGAGRKEKRKPEPAKDSLKNRTEDLKGDFRILEQIEVIHSDEFI